MLKQEMEESVEEERVECSSEGRVDGQKRIKTKGGGFGWGGRKLWRPEKQAENKQIERERGEKQTGRLREMEGWRQAQHELKIGERQTREESK